jgi:hypothetical protein
VSCTAHAVDDFHPLFTVTRVSSLWRLTVLLSLSHPETEGCASQLPRGSKCCWVIQPSPPISLGCAVSCADIPQRLCVTWEVCELRCAPLIICPCSAVPCDHMKHPIPDSRAPLLRLLTHCHARRSTTPHLQAGRCKQADCRTPPNCSHQTLQYCNIRPSQPRT